MPKITTNPLPNPFPYECKRKDCGFKTFNDVDFLFHNERHKQEKNYTCVECQFSCNTRSKIVSHMKSHSDEKAYRCNSCEFTARALSGLLQHQKMHKKNKFPCDECGKEFNLKRYLVRHKKKMHTRQEEEKRKGGEMSEKETDKSDVIELASFSGLS